MQDGLEKTASAESHKQHISEKPWTIRNWYHHIDWLNTHTIITLPIIGFILAVFTPLQTETAAFTIIYYFITGLGITAGRQF
jgi:stearoyl-CoA desaturase (Delta-9 desaturase)